METQDKFLNMPIFDMVDLYFSAFDKLKMLYFYNVNIYACDDNQYWRDKYSEATNDTNIFSVDLQAIKKQIAINLHNNRNNEKFLKNYIKDKYLSVKNELITINKAYIEYNVCLFVEMKLKAKARSTPFFNNLCILIANTTIEDFYNAMTKELENGYNSIMKLFADNDTKSEINAKPKTDDTPALQQTFSDYLHHSDKTALLKKLNELLDGKKGKDVAKVLEALQNKNYLQKNSYNTTDVISEFNLSCSRQSITNYLNKGNIPKDEIQQIVDLLP